MPIPETTFNADECQALLDYIERLERHVTLAASYVPEHQDALRTSDEEAEALNKLREAGKFYAPDSDQCPECGGEITPEDPHSACLDEAQSRA